MGGTVGCITAGYIGDKYGRKMIFNVSLAIMVVFGYLSSISTGLNEFIVYRFITLVGLGNLVSIVVPKLDE